MVFLELLVLQDRQDLLDLVVDLGLHNFKHSSNLDQKDPLLLPLLLHLTSLPMRFPRSCAMTRL